MVDAAGQVIVDLYQNLEEIRASLGAGGAENALVRGAIERAEEQLRVKARELVDAARSQGGAPPEAAAATWPRGGRGEPAPPPGLPNNPGPPAKPRPFMPTGIQCEVPRLRQRARTAPRGKRAQSKNSGPQRLLPKNNRLDPLYDPPALSEGDMNTGLLNLMNRGFIPPAADVTPALERGVPVVLQRPAPLYHQSHKFARRDIATGGDVTNSVWLDLRPPEPPYGSRSILDSPGKAHSASPRQLAPLRKQPSHPSTLLALPAPQYDFGGANFGGGSATFYTELLDGSVDTQGDTFSLTQGSPLERSPSQPPPGKSKDFQRALSATRIAAHWRGVKSRRRVDHLRVQHEAARRMQEAWHSCTTRAATKFKIQQSREADRKRHAELMYALGQDWFHMRQQRRVEIHICSASIAPHRRQNMINFKALQAAQLGRAFRLLDKRIDIIFVAPKALHEDIVDYYSKIMQYRGVKNPAGRFQVVAPEVKGLPDNLSLTQALLCFPRALRRLKKLIGGRTALVVPDVVSHAELKLCATLDLPLLGAGPRNIALLASKSNAKRLVTLAELPAGPWAVDIYDEDEFYTSLADMVVRHPEVRYWVFKIDDERSSRGHAYVDLAQLRSVAELLRSAQANAARTAAAAAASAAATGESAGNLHGSAAPAEPSYSASDVEQVQQALRKHLPRKVVICNRRAYPDFTAWLAEASRVGMVVQAVPEGLLSQTSVHLQIDPDGSTCILGTSEAVCSQPFVRAASWYPHTRGSWEALREVGMRMGRVLAGKGMVGFASVDVVFFENPEFDAARCAEADREPTPHVIGSDTPVEPGQLMFDGLRSPSPQMSVAEEVESGATISLPESRQADYELALRLRDSTQREARDPVSLMLGNRMYASPLSRWSCWVVDVDAFLTDEAVALFPLQFVAQVRFDQATGDMRLTPDAQSAQADASAGPGAPPLEAEDLDLKMRRWALVSHAAYTPGMEKMSYQSLFQAAKMRGVSFDLFNNVGCVFTFLDVFSSLFSLLSIERTAEACAKRLASAISAITEGLGPKGQLGAHSKMSAPRDAPLPVSMEGDAQDSLCVSDVQMALRSLLRQFTERASKKSGSR